MSKLINWIRGAVFAFAVIFAVNAGTTEADAQSYYYGGPYHGVTVGPPHVVGHPYHRHRVRPGPHRPHYMVNPRSRAYYRPPPRRRPPHHYALPAAAGFVGGAVMSRRSYGYRGHTAASAPGPREIYSRARRTTKYVCVPCVDGYMQNPDTCDCTRVTWRPGPPPVH
jgi:hypothetical protein